MISPLWVAFLMATILILVTLAHQTLLSKSHMFMYWNANIYYTIHAINLHVPRMLKTGYVHRQRMLCVMPRIHWKNLAVLSG